MSGRYLTTGPVDPAGAPWDFDDVAAHVAAQLGVPAGDVTVVVNAAAQHVATRTGRSIDQLAGDDAMLFHGLSLLARRIWLDTPVPSSQLAVVEDLTLSGLGLPEDLDRHLHHYWDHLTVSWGVA